MWGGDLDMEKQMIDYTTHTIYIKYSNELHVFFLKSSRVLTELQEPAFKFQTYK